MDNDTVNYINYATTGEYNDSRFCPEDFKIPTKSDYESIISELGSNAYSYFSQVNGLNMKEGLYYLTNTKGSGGSYYKYFLVLKGNSLTFEDKHPFDVKGRVRCMLSLTHFKIISPNNDNDLDLNQKSIIKNNFSKYFIGYIWKIGKDIFKTETVEYTFSQSGGHKIEFWGKYNDN